MPYSPSSSDSVFVSPTSAHVDQTLAADYDGGLSHDLVDAA